VLPGNDLNAEKNAAAGTTVRHASFNMGTQSFLDAAAFGNYHASYTGTHAGESRVKQYSYAGLGEVAKFRDMFTRLRQIELSVPPYGDPTTDFIYNSLGMSAAEAEIAKDGRPTRSTHYYPYY